MLKTFPERELLDNCRDAVTALGWERFIESFILARSRNWLPPVPRGRRLP
ncbi:hypothetical protein JW905_00580 [bacterium]|nr:hypothetical protein [candidate division CSSED10-310 bacterium]